MKCIFDAFHETWRRKGTGGKKSVESMWPQATDLWIAGMR